MVSTLWPVLTGWLAVHWRELALSALFLACAFRERGQDHDSLGTTGARALFWALPVAADVYLLLAGLTLDRAAAITAAQCGALAFAGMAWLPHSAGQNLTETPADYPASWTARISLPNKLGYLAAVGIARLYLIALPLAHDHPAAMWLPLGGLSMVLAYLAGTRMPALPWRLTRPTEWGEFLTGAGAGAAIGAVLVAGQVDFLALM